VSTLRNSGTTRLNLPAAAGPRKTAEPPDELLEAVREVAAGEFAVLGEIGRAPDGTIAYLARDLSTQKLVALRVARGGASGAEYLLDVADQLDASVPAPPTQCPRCNAALRGWGRFCTQCGASLESARGTGEPLDKAELLTAVQEATRGRFEILGEMSRAEGGAVIYFARDPETGKIEALRLQKESDGQFSIGLTGVLTRFAGSLPPERRRPPGR
jgi:hypothetical protein